MNSATTPASTTVSVGSDYDVVIGRGVSGQLGDRLPALLQRSAGEMTRVLVVSAPSVADLARRCADACEAAGFEVHSAVVPEGERAKTAEVLGELWGRLGRAGFTRSDAVVAVGGGSVTDLAGFVAASWLRGVAVVHVPTTLLAMVDAAVGGKTGINTAEGKNLVGAFHPPAGVICDLEVLATLPTADLVAGMAEVVKAGFIADPVILELIESDVEGATRCDGAALPELVRRAVQVKADVVAADLRESHLREILNYGHTFGHAIEQVHGYTWRHGEAVSVGLVYAAELAGLAGRLDAALIARHRSVLQAVGLPTAYSTGGVDRFEDLLTAMTRDKKTRGSTLRFVVLDGLARPGRLVGPDVSMLRAAYERVAG